MKKRGHCTFSGSVWSILICARRTNSYYNAPSKLARTSPRRVVWIYPLLRTLSDHRSSIFSLEGGLDWSPTARVSLAGQGLG